MRLNVKAFAAACGLLWGFGVLCFTWWRLLFEDRGEDDTIIGHIYRGYELTPMGSLIGFLWALVDGTAGGAIFAWLYNTIADRLPGQDPEATGARQELGPRSPGRRQNQATYPRRCVRP